MTSLEEGAKSISRPAFRADVQGLRAVAVAIVVLYHAELSFSGGFVGVDVFFVLSGFVIMRGLQHELVQTGRIDLKGFAMRRVRRLLPAFALLLAFVMPMAIFFAPVDGFFPGASTANAAALFNANTYLNFVGEGYFSTSAELNPLLHTWSLSVEEQFYLVFPTVMYASWWLGERFGGSGRRGLKWALLIVGIFSFVASEALVSGILDFSVDTPWRSFRIDERVAFFAAPTRAWEFAAGAFMAFVRSSRSGRAGSASAAAGICLLAYCSFAYSSPGTSFPGLLAAIPVGATIALLWAGGAGPIGRVLSSAPFQRVGDLSYGWYLWHWPMIVFAHAMTANTFLDSPWFVAAIAVLALVPADLSLRLLENPIRRAHTMGPQMVMRLGFACLFVPVVVTLVSVTARDAAYGESVDEFEDQFAIHLDAKNGCDSNFVSAGPSNGECEFEAEISIGRAILIGDSNAGHLSEGALRGLLLAGYDLEIATRSSCLFSDLETVVDGVALTNCTLAVTRTTQRVIDEGFDLVILGHAADTYVDDPDFQLVDDEDGSRIGSAEQKRVDIADAMARKVAEFRSAGIAVVVAQPVPRLSDWEPGACALVRWAKSTENCAGSISNDALRAQAESLAVINEQIEDAGGRILRFNDRLCEAERCEVIDDGVYLYRDGLHLSVAGSQQLADDFFALVEDRDSVPAQGLPFSE